MDAQGRRHAGDIDPADQWVFNPSTGTYELQSGPAADNSRHTYGNGDRMTAPRQRTPSSSQPTDRQRAETDGYVPPQRGRRRARPQDDGEHPRSGDDGGGPRASRRKPRPKPTGKKRALQWGGGILGMLLLVGCASAGWMYYRLNGNLTTVDVGIDNPAVSDGPLNILLIGTDSRQGKGNDGYGDAESVGHADTTLLFHVSADRSNATVLSIPRDLMVDVPDCPVTQEDGSKKIIPGTQNVRFNTSLGQFGRDPGCTWRTVHEVTGVQPNHFMLADFNAVKELSTAVGGVGVCLEHPVKDPKSHLDLPAGRSVVEGEQALAFVRTRKSIGFSSDLDRIKLQQQFLSSMVRKMKSSDTLTDPGKLFDLADVATKSLTVDDGIGGVDKLIALAKDLRRVDTKNISFVTAPVLDNPEDPNTVILDPNKAQPLFRMVQQDKSLTKTDKGKKKAKKDQGADLSKVEKAPASEVRVDVLNGGAPAGSAQTTLTWLQTEQGVPLSTNAGNAPKELEKTTLAYAPNQASQAAALAEMMGLPSSALKETSGDAGPQEGMTLTLGADFVEPGVKLEAPDKAPVDAVNAGDKSLCAG
ncbi:LCP family protein [Streptomyces sp. DSM 42041]|uniref:LCP family protein n=1 Tax=Streptomyces hazeniae TaxID=3075538 RepID=A0ABU2NZF8_9ACTN|nr:LCP family protein [Streptomyces sp. DSM 42041]MDT0382370.1 LCP family protein [Streptomyces sp. DSM 42041]